MDRSEVDVMRRRALAHDLREQGFSFTEIGRQTGVSVRTSERYLNQPKPPVPAVPRNRSWLGGAACAGKSTEMFFPDEVGMGGRRQKLAAIAVCHSCPVIAQCRQAAIAQFETNGVWGGEDFSNAKYFFNEATGCIDVVIRDRRAAHEKVS